MDRKVLEILLRSGPARKFDTRYFTEKQQNSSDNKEFLFDDWILNQSILFKHSLFDSHDRSLPNKPVKTLVYVPYDSNSPQDGGESFIYTEKNYKEFYSCKKDHGGERFKPTEHDLEILTVMDSVPTFSPLILEMAFERSTLKIPTAYLDLTDEMRRKLKALMKSRIRPLIIAAFGNEPRRVEHAVEGLTTKLFQLHSAEEILPFVTALHLPESEAVELMSSWVGITYFEHEYASAQNDLLGVAEFLNSNPHRRGNLNRVNREEIYHNVEFIRNKLKADWAKIRRLSTVYKRAYEGLVFNGDVRTFRDFLLNCRNSYWELGDLLGRFEQTAIAWKSFSVVKTADVPAGMLIDFLIMMRSLNTTVTVQEVTGRLGQDREGFASFSSELF